MCAALFKTDAPPAELIGVLIFVHLSRYGVKFVKNASTMHMTFSNSGWRVLHTRK